MINSIQRQNTNTLLNDSFINNVLSNHFENCTQVEIGNFQIKLDDDRQIISFYNTERMIFTRCITKVYLRGSNAFKRDVKDDNTEKDISNLLRLMHQ
jgi:hypothetical protein